MTIIELYGCVICSELRCRYTPVSRPLHDRCPAPNDSAVVVLHTVNWPSLLALPATLALPGFGDSVDIKVVVAVVMCTAALPTLLVKSRSVAYPSVTRHATRHANRYGNR